MIWKSGCRSSKKIMLKDESRPIAQPLQPPAALMSCGVSGQTKGRPRAPKLLRPMSVATADVFRRLPVFVACRLSCGSNVVRLRAARVTGDTARLGAFMSSRLPINSRANYAADRSLRAFSILRGLLMGRPLDTDLSDTRLRDAGLFRGIVQQ
jgi:hypothetical protein